MRVINLARRPFVNRSPVVRAAGVLWALAVVLLLLNVYLYRSHFVDSKNERDELARVERDLGVQDQQLDAQYRQLATVDLSSLNRQTNFLNVLISYRTFPWSALFEDLEDVLPADVRLLVVDPGVRLAPQAGRRGSERRRTTGTSGGSAEERRTSRTSSRPTSSSGSRAAEDGEPADTAAARRDPLTSDEVVLQLAGYAKNRDALYEFVDRLYESPFRVPYLANASFDSNQGPQAVNFRLTVIYLTRRPAIEPEESADELVAEGEEGPGESSGDDPEEGEEDDPESSARLAGSSSSEEDSAASSQIVDQSATEAPEPAPPTPATAPTPRTSTTRSLPPRWSPASSSERTARDRAPVSGSSEGDADPVGRKSGGLARSRTVVPGIPSALQPVPSATAPAPPMTDPAPRTAPARPGRAVRPPRTRPPVSGRGTPPRGASDPSIDENPGFRDPDASSTPRGSLRPGPVLPARLELTPAYPDLSMVEGVAA